MVVRRMAASNEDEDEDEEEAEQQESSRRGTRITRVDSGWMAEGWHISDRAPSSNKHGHDAQCCDATTS